MRALIDLYAKNYAPYEWKKTLLKFDALRAGPWLEKAAAARNDLEFFDVCIEYVSSLFDAHDVYRLPSSFNASLGFTVDIYEGKVLIDSIDELRLPKASFDAAAGDELVSIDGKKVEDWLKEGVRYGFGGNRSANQRDLAGLFTQRSQTIMPLAHRNLGDEAEVVVRNAEGQTKTLKAPWRKRGVAVERLLWPNAVTNAKPSVHRGIDFSNPLEYLAAKQNLRVDAGGRAMVRGYGAREPVFALPEDASITIGRSQFDSIFGGTIPFEEKRIGFIRIPQVTGAAQVRAFRDTLNAMKETTDALVLDLTRNPGGSACALEDLAAELMKDDWKVQGAEQIVAWRDILGLQSSLDTARALGLDEVVRNLEFDLLHYERAYKEWKGRTAPIPFCTADETRKGLERAYTKPVLVLIDEFSTSAAEHLAALLQDNNRAKLFGKRTTGAGGAVLSGNVGIYSEGRTSYTWTLTNRTRTIKTADHPEAPYIENIGVQPDIEFEMNTRENLLAKGKLYTDGFLKAAKELIQ